MVVEHIRKELSQTFQIKKAAKLVKAVTAMLRQANKHNVNRHSQLLYVTIIISITFNYFRAGNNVHELWLI